MRTSVCLAVCLSFVSLVPVEGVTAVPADPAVSAVRSHDCRKAVKAITDAIGSSNPVSSIFFGGRMLDEGICVARDPVRAAGYFERASGLGDANAQLEYAAKIGLGEGAQQDYVLAGQKCHEAGMDPGGLVPLYSLGYSCTVSRVAGRLLRESLPRGAFLLPTEPAVVEFNPVSSTLTIVSAPTARRGEAPLGQFIGPILVDPNDAIKKAWRTALSTVPKPSAESLSPELIRMNLDVDATLESNRASSSTAQNHLTPGELHMPVLKPGGTI